MAKVAINGLGRIGRATLKVLLDTPALDVVAINDIAPLDNFVYLLRYDTVYGRYPKSVEAKNGNLVIDGQEIRFLSERDPANLPWKEMGVELVFESTGFFTDRAGASKHLEAGADHVIISAPTKSEETPTVVHGVNTEMGMGIDVLSTASCTTNSLTPVVEIVGRRIGIEKALMTTVHGYTASQALVDSPMKKMRRGRAAAQNIVPTSTGAAVATTKALPEYQNKFDGVALRVPVPVGSISDITFVTSRDTSVEEVNKILKEEAATDRYRDIFAVTEDELVSSDIIGNPHASIADLEMTRVVGGNLVKIMAWYDNEWGYTNQMVRQALVLLGERETA
jgi:glyceraldehyde 3-phosphate dehydrogenase